MLSRKNNIFLAVQASVTIALLSGCVITSSPTGAGAGGESTTTATTTAVTTGTGGAGVTGSTSGTGGGACVGETGKAMISDCELLNIAPASGASSSCGVNLNEAPPGYGLCKRGFSLFNPGAVSTLVTCLGTIGVQDECKTPPLLECVDKMFADECAIATIVASCGDIATACGTDPFDTGKCAKDLNPFSDKGLAEIQDCLNNKADPALSCQAAYDFCYTEVFTF